MKLWGISQIFNTGYDTYDSAVVAAEDEEAARNTYPGTNMGDWDPDPDYYIRSYWVLDRSLVTVQLLGTAIEGIEAGVVCASFNAG